MKIEIDLLSTEVVAPCSPTPLHLNRYNLSLIDQAMPPIFMPFVFYYPPNDNLIKNTNSQKSNHLKNSLSQTLTLFYPLAGRLVGNRYVNCNDKGITFIVAQANCKLYDVIIDPIPDVLNKFIPCDPDHDRCLAVQATFFVCGGLAIGFTIPHKLVDALSAFMFVYIWAAISRGDVNVVKFPKFESAVMFPPIDLGSRSFIPFPIDKKEKIVNKRFVFTAQKIADLREKYYSTKKNANDEGPIRGLSRTEILSAFIWTRFMVSTGAKDDASKVCALRIFVDIRTRVVPPLSEYHFGNLVLPATVVTSLENDYDRTYGMVKKIRDAIGNADVDYASINNIVENTTPINEVVMLMFSSITKLPLHKADFGWGSPVWFGIAKIPVSNIIFFVDTLSEGGIEAMVNLKEEDMAKFELDEELLEYVSSKDDSKLWSKI